jgi:hypothetical protein
MDINASIIDQRLVGVAAGIGARAIAELNISGDKLLPLAFVYFCVKTTLDLDEDETFECLTEGSGDFGVDAFHATEDIDGEFTVTLFQAKYKAKLDGDANFPVTGIGAVINAIRHVFDPSSTLGAINDRLRVKVEQARSMIRDGAIPRVRVVACNNGKKWNADGDAAIARANLGGQVSWEHVNHDVLLGILQRTKPVSETLKLVGKAIIEDMNFSRVCIGRIPVSEIADLIKRHGDRLLERNIRRYLGLHGNRVNEAIRSTLTSAEPSDFYFLNNGLTLVCDDFNYNSLQNSDYQIKVDNLQIVNGGQTCMTIFRTAQELESQKQSLPASAAVMVRLYKLPNEDTALKITQATNSQNPVDLKDLKANDAKQQQLEESIKNCGFAYRRKRSDSSPRASEITTGAAAEAVLAVWRHAPHQAKFLTREHFGKLYNTIFTADLNGPQVILASLLYRIAENHRRRPGDTEPVFVRYASCFIAMQMGRRLLKGLGAATLESLSHRNFDQAKALVEGHGERYFAQSTADVKTALVALYGNQEISLQQLSATFRRGDLIEKMRQISC